MKDDYFFFWVTKFFFQRQTFFRVKSFIIYLEHLENSMVLEKKNVKFMKKIHIPRFWPLWHLRVSSGLYLAAHHRGPGGHHSPTRSAHAAKIIIGLWVLVLVLLPQ